MTQIVYANVKGEPLLAPVGLRPRKRRLDRVIREWAKDLDAPFMVSIHRPGEILSPTEDSIRIRPEAIPADLKPRERKEWEARLWQNTVVERNEIVLITVMPAGGKGGGAGKIALTIASIALMAFAGPLAGTLAAAFDITNKFAIAAIQAGITIGGAALLMAFSRKNENGGQIFGVSGGGTLPRPNDRIPVGYGRFWTQPDLTQPDYYRYQDQEDTILFKRMSIGLGKYKLRRIRVGTTTFWAGDLLSPNGGVVTSGITEPFPNCKFELIYGTASTLVPSSVITSPSVTGQTIPLSNDPDPVLGPFAVNGVGTTVTKLQVDFSTPSGYSRNNHETTQDLHFEYAPINDSDVVTGSWQTLYRTTAGLFTKKHLRWSKMLDVPAGRYAVRAKNARARIDDGDNCNYSWDGLRGYVPDEIVREERTELTLQVTSGENLDITSFSDVWVEVERWGPVWNATTEAFEEGHIRKCLDCMVDVLTDDFYGAGESVSRIDMAKVAAYRTAITEYDTYDGLIRGPITVRNVLEQILFNMRAEPIRLGNGYTFIRDEPSAIRRHVFSRSQLLRDSAVIKEVPKVEEGQADVVAEFSPDADPKRKQTVRAFYGTQSRTPQRFDMPGVKTADHARHLARWRAASAYYRRTQISFDTELAGRIPLRGESALVDPWFVDERKVAAAVSLSGLTLTVDRDIEVVTDDRLVLRDTTGMEWGPVRVTQGASLRLLELNAGDVATEELSSGIGIEDVLAPENAGIPTSVIVGPLADLGVTWLIKDMTPSDDGKTSIVALIDSAEVYSAIGAVMPADDPLTWELVPAAAPTISRVTASIVRIGTGLEIQWSISAEVGAVRYEVEIAYATGSGATWEPVYNGPTAVGSAPIVFLETRNPVYLRARAFGASGLSGGWKQAASAVAPPPVVVATEAYAGAIKYEHLESPLRQTIDSMTGFGADSIRDLLRQYEERLEAQGEAVARAITQTNILLAKAENNSTASIVEERSVRASADEANATLITGLSASLDTLDGTVTGLASTVSETSATVTTQGGTLTALASDLSTLTATVGTTSTTVSGHTTAITNLEGETYGSWGVEITTQKNIIGETVKKVSGFKLHQAGGEGEIVSEFRINSDKFSVFPADSDPNTNTYDTPLFTIGSVAGGPSNRAGLNAFAFLDGTLQARMLVADEVVVANTIQLQNSIVTVPHVITYSTPVAGTGIGNLIDIVDTMFEVTVPNGQSIPIFFNGGMSLEYLNTSTTRWDLDFKVSWRNVGGSYGTESSLFAMTCGSTATVSAPFGGAYTITGTGAIQQVRARLVWTAASNIRAGNRYLSCQAAKR